MKLVLLHKGEFDMGSEETFSEEPMHHVTLTKDFYLGAEQVTVAQFRVFVKATGYKTETEQNGKGCLGLDPDTKWFAEKPEYTWRKPSFEQGDDHPVVCVSWNDAKAYVAWLSKMIVRYRNCSPTVMRVSSCSTVGFHPL